MSKTFRAWKIGEPLLLPVTVQEFVPRDHLARFVLSVVEEELDLSAIMSRYSSEKGQPPFHPAMMTALLLYAYCSGVYSSRRIAKACGERVDFMSIVGHDAPDFRTIAEFRDYRLYLLSRGLKAKSINPIVGGLRFFYGTTLGNKQLAEQIPFARVEETLPAVLSRGHRAAVMYTLIETAKLSNVDPKAWLADVLARIADHPSRRFSGDSGRH